jgi:MinD-like ATPase involved in chromosome partitioning or flagellar assembly
VATDDRDKPADVADAAGAAAGARDDLAAGSTVPSENETNGRPLNGTANGAANGAPYGPEGGADSGAEGGSEGGAGAEVGGADDYEPYLPPGPNPFSSVHPQGTPAPYRPLGGNGSLGSAGPQGSAGPLGGNGAYPPPFDRDPWSADRAPAPPEPAGEREPGAGPEPEGDHGTGAGPGFEAESGAEHLRGAAESAEPPAPPHPGVSPYPPLPSDEFDGGRASQPGYGSASPYPTYTPYGPDDEIADDALTDYGLPSPQSYGYAPPPPLAEPLPDVGVPEPRFGPSAPSAPQGSPAPQAPAASPASPAFPASPAPQASPAFPDSPASRSSQASPTSSTPQAPPAFPDSSAPQTPSAPQAPLDSSAPPGPQASASQAPSAPQAPLGSQAPLAPSAPLASGYRENGPDDGDFQDRAYRDRDGGFRDSGSQASSFQDGGFQDRGVQDDDSRDDDFRGDDFRIDPFRVGESRAEDTGYRDEPASVSSRPPAGRFPAESDRPDDEDVPPLDFGSDRDPLAGGHRRGPGSPGQHRVSSGDTGLRGAPPPTGLPQPGLPQPGLPQPGATPSGAVRPGVAPPGLAQPGPGQPGLAQSGPARPGVAPARNPAAAPPLGRPVAPPERSQPGYPPAGPPQGGTQRGPVPGMTGPGGRPPRPALDDDEYDQEPAGDSGHETSDSLTAEALLHGKRIAPGAGWRRTVYRATGGLVRVGESSGMQRRRELVWRARTPVAGGHHRVAVMSLKGGVGKTTTTVGLGATLASLRGDRVIAVDANPDRGTLSDKVRLETSATVRDLLNERQQVHRYADVRAFTSQASSRLEVLASDRDPGVSVAFSDTDYRDVARVLEHYYSICITDCGTGLLHSAMTGVLTLADQIILVSSPSVDGARSASATLDWLDAHGYGDLVRNAVVVLSTVRPRSKSTVDLDRLEQHFAARCRDVVRVPYDAHLEEGAEVELEQLSPATTEAYLRLAATVGDGFAWPRRTLNRSAAQQH